MKTALGKALVAIATVLGCVSPITFAQTNNDDLDGFAQVLGAIPPVTLTATPARVPVGGTVSLVATVPAPYQITTTQFYLGNALFGSPARGGSTTWTPASGGIFVFTATATTSSGAVGGSEPVGVIACARPTVTVTASGGNAAVVGTDVNLTATLSTGSTYCANTSVKFYEQHGGQARAIVGSVIKPALGATENVTWRPQLAQTYTITADVTDDVNPIVTSAGYAVNVSASGGGGGGGGGNTAPTISSVTPTSATVTLGSNVVFTVAATDTAGDTLTVQLLDAGGGALATGVALGGNIFTLTWKPPSATVFSLKIKVTDSSNLSATRDVQVTAIAPAGGAVGDADIVCMAPTVTSTIGSIAGTFGVSDTGGATYQIPIEVPPGTNGIQPSLALSYNSQGGYGTLGLGWSVSGLSAVTRCAATEAQDGVRAGINYDTSTTNDAFCLDGQRLIPISRTGNTTEYRTEIDSYSKIQRIDDSTSVTVVGPARWIIYTKAGLVLNYGSRWWVVSRGFSQRFADSQRVNTVKLWPLDEVADKFGNNIEIDYSGSNGGANVVPPNQPYLPNSTFGPGVGAFIDVEYWPTVIRYYPSTPAGTSSRGYNAVLFKYEELQRTGEPADFLRMFDSGAGASTLSQRLRAIDVYADSEGPGNRVRSYRLAYSTDTYTLRDTLSSVTLCANDDSTCLPPTSFTWTATSLNFSGPNSSDSRPLLNTAAANVKVADLNGDGRSDLIAYVGTSGTRYDWNVCFGPLANGCTRYTMDSFSDGGNPERWLVADVDGSGKAALLTYDGSTTGSTAWRICRFAGAGFTCDSWTGPALYRNNAWTDFFWGDLNGDGKIDLIVKTGAKNSSNAYLWDICLATGSTFACQYDQVISPSTSADSSKSRVLIGDLDGDGKADFLERVTDNPSDTNWLPCQSSFALQTNSNGSLEAVGRFTCGPNPVTAAFGAFGKIAALDMNGDGLVDLVTRPLTPPPLGQGDIGSEACWATNPSTCWQVCLSSGDGAFDYRDLVTWDMDGNLISAVPGAPNPIVQPWYQLPRCRYWTAQAATMSEVKFGDFDGDGRTDMAVWTMPNGAPHQWKICYSSGNDLKNCRNVTFPSSNMQAMTDVASSTLTGDFDGDGKTDIIVNLGGGNWAVGIGDAGGAQRINRVKTGLGATTDVTYAPLTDASVYAPGGTATLAARDLTIQSPLYVVKQTQASAGSGIADTLTTDYFYEQLVGSTDGRGLKGFYKRRILDGNGVVTEVESLLAWPFTGQPRVTTKWAPINGSRSAASVLASSPSLNSSFVKLHSITAHYTAREFRPGWAYQEGTIFSFSEPTDATRPIYQIYTDTVTEEPFAYVAGQASAAALPFTTTTTSNPDDYGNAGTVVVTVTDAVDGGNYIKTTKSEFSNNKGDWIIGRTTKATVESKSPGSLALMTRVSSWNYGTLVPNINAPSDGQCWWGLVCTETIEPDPNSDPTLWQATDYSYDRFGNQISVTVRYREPQSSGTITLQRTTRTLYDSNLGAGGNRGRFVTTVENARGDQQIRQYDSRFGIPTLVKAFNGQYARADVDAFGHKTCTSTYDGYPAGAHLLGQIETQLQSCGSPDGDPGIGVPSSQIASYQSASGCFFGIGERYRVRTKTSGSGASYAFYDDLQRERRVSTKAFNVNSWATVATTFDALGRKTAVSRPSGSGTATDAFTYDVLNRSDVVTTTGTNGTGSRTTVATTTYAGLTTKVTRTNPSGGQPQSTTTRVNGLGQVRAVVDALNQTTSYSYDQHGNLTNVTTPSGFAVNMTYDVRGRKQGRSDPDTGQRQYVYNGIGELVKQTDAMSRDTRQIFDALGRVIERREFGGTENSAIVFATTWTYDNCGGRSTGLQCSSESHNGLPFSSANFVHSQSLLYDSAARPYSRTTYIGAEQFIDTQEFDGNGRVTKIVYPIVSPSGVAVRRTYAAWNGELESVIDDATGATIWQVTGRVADGQVSAMLVGPHTTTKSYDPLGRVAAVTTPGVQSATYSFDELGNLIRRSDSLTGQADETYGYDPLNRVTTSSLRGTIASYGPDGNLNTKDGVRGNLTYLGTSHQVTSGNGQTYSYDPNGNLTTGAGRTITVNQFNLPASIATGSGSVAYQYDGNHSRVVETSTATGTTKYVGSQFFEQQTLADNSGNRRYFVATPEGVVAIILKKFDRSGVVTTSTTTYWHKDHIGSVVAVTNQAGTVLEKSFYDIWGKRNQTGTGALEERGFTGHQQIDETSVGGISLVHMNGRIYDPSIGRFLSADPIVQAPLNGQNYNGYSYVLNNPLSFTDPTGFSFWTKWRRPIFAIAVAAALGPGGVLASLEVVPTVGIVGVVYTGTGAALGSAVIAGFAAGGIAGGNLESAVQGAFTSALFFGAGQLARELALSGFDGFASGGIGKIGLHAAVGCASAAFAGGNCGGGAVSAGFAQVFGGVYNKQDFATGLVVSTVAGGLGAKLVGGSAQSGALLGAFAYLFNETSHRTEDAVAYVGYDPKQLAEVAYHLKWVYDINNGIGPDASSFWADPSAAPERAMYARLLAGRSSDFDVQFFRHEVAEASLVRARGGYAADLDTAYNIQTNAHRDVLKMYDNSSVDLYHPSVVRANAEWLNGPAFQRRWPDIFGPK